MPTCATRLLRERQQRSFTDQLTYTSGNPIAWSFRLSTYLRSIATSNASVDARVFRHGAATSYSYTKRAPCDYTFHSTLKGSSNKYRYQLGGTYTFRVNAGGRPGTAYVRMTFDCEISYV